MKRDELIKRTTDRYTGDGKVISPLKAIRQYCVRWCMNDSAREVDLCTSTDCQLFEFRYGRNPHAHSSGAGNIANLVFGHRTESVSGTTEGDDGTR